MSAGSGVNTSTPRSSRPSSRAIATTASTRYAAAGTVRKASSPNAATAVRIASFTLVIVPPTLSDWWYATGSWMSFVTTRSRIAKSTERRTAHVCTSRSRARKTRASSTATSASTAVPTVRAASPGAVRRAAAPRVSKNHLRASGSLTPTTARASAIVTTRSTAAR